MVSKGFDLEAFIILKPIKKTQPSSSMKWHWITTKEVWATFAQVSNEKQPGCLVYIEDYTTQWPLCGDQ